MVKLIQRTVKKIYDGDTFKVGKKIGNTDVIRIAGLNAPEKWQYGGRKATNRLRGLIGGKKVKIKPLAKDKYGRIIAKVIYKGKDVARILRKSR